MSLNKSSITSGSIDGLRSDILIPSNCFPGDAIWKQISISSAVYRATSYKQFKMDPFNGKSSGILLLNYKGGGSIKNEIKKSANSNISMFTRHISEHSLKAN